MTRQRWWAVGLLVAIVAFFALWGTRKRTMERTVPAWQLEQNAAQPNHLQGELATLSDADSAAMNGPFSGHLCAPSYARRSWPGHIADLDGSIVVRGGI